MYPVPGALHTSLQIIIKTASGATSLSNEMFTWPQGKKLGRRGGLGALKKKKKKQISSIFFSFFFLKKTKVITRLSLWGSVQRSTQTALLFF